MSARATRRTQAEPDFSTLTNLDSLILAQAVYELGSNSWSAVAKILSKHPLLSHPRAFFTAQSCQAMYKHLLQETSLEMTDADIKRHAPLSLKLAQKFYQARLLELRDLIGVEEEKFKKITAEIEDIRKGAQDEEVKARIAGVAIQPKLIEDHTATDQSQAKEDDLASDSSRLSSASSSEKSSEKNDSLHLPHKDPTPPILEFPVGEVEPTPEEQEPVAPQGDVPEAQPIIAETRTDEEPINTSKDGEAETVDNQDTRASTPASMPEAPSPQVIEIDSLLEPEPEPEDNDVSLAQPEMQGQETSRVIYPERSVEVDNREQTEPTSSIKAQTSEAVATAEAKENFEYERSHSVTPVAMDVDASEPLTVTAAPTVPFEPPIDPLLLAEDEKSQPSRHQSRELATPLENMADVENERMDVMEDEGPASGDELPYKPRVSRRNRPSTAAPLQTRSGRARRQRRASIPASEHDLESEEPEPEAEEEKGPTPAQTPGIVEEPSPVPDAIPYKRPGKRTASSIDGTDTPRDKKRIRDDSEPAEDEEPGPTSTTRTRRRNENQAIKRFQNVIGMLHSQISQHRNGTIFHNPIKDSEAPDYHEIVKRPMDLKTIKAKIRDGLITNSLEFQRDIFLMFANAMMYNRPGSDVYIMAEDMMLESEGYIQTFRQTEGFVRGSQR